MKEIFGSGTARGGTGLIVQTRRAHSQIEIAMEPFLALFKRYRIDVHRDPASTIDVLAIPNLIRGEKLTHSGNCRSRRRGMSRSGTHR